MKEHELAKIDYTNGMSIKKIATKYNVKETAVRKWKSRHKWGDVTKDMSHNPVTTNKRSSIDWLKMQIEYVTDISKRPVTLKDLSKKYGVSHLVIQQYSSDKKWSELRKKHFRKVSEKTQEKLIEETSDMMADLLININTALLKATEELHTYEEVNGFGKLIYTETDTVRTDKLGRLVKALTSMQKIELEKQRLEIERKKVEPQEKSTEQKLDQYLSTLMEVLNESEET